ncbi:MAG: thioredoxin family protein [Candidatus Hermodarchaeota archaeon]
MFEQAYREYSHEFIFVKVNVDENPMIAQFYGIRSIPTTVFKKGGNFLRKFVGLLNYESLKQILSKFKI